MGLTFTTSCTCQFGNKNWGCLTKNLHTLTEKNHFCIFKFVSRVPMSNNDKGNSPVGAADSGEIPWGLNQGSLTLALLTLGARWLFAVELLVHCGVFSSCPDFHLPGARSNFSQWGWPVFSNIAKSLNWSQMRPTGLNQWVSTLSA